VSRRRALLMAAAGGGGDLTEGLVFYASFRSGIWAESGQELTVDGEAYWAFDDELGRGAMFFSYGSVKFSTENLPVGDEPFTVAAKLRLPYGPHDGFFAFGWGSTPYGPTVAGLACSSSGLGLRNWGFGLGDVGGTDWHHLAGTYDGVTVRFYVDGQLDSAMSISGLTTGGETGSFGTFWAGDYTDCRCANARIYNRALSAAEVASLAKEE